MQFISILKFKSNMFKSNKIRKKGTFYTDFKHLFNRLFFLFSLKLILKNFMKLYQAMSLMWRYSKKHDNGDYEMS